MQPLRLHTAVAGRRARLTLKRRRGSVDIASVARPQKALTIRLSHEQAEELELVAAVEQQPVSEVIRSAIAEHIANRKQDKTFRKDLMDRIERALRMIGD